MTKPGQHRWRPAQRRASGPKVWRCTQCGLQRVAAHETKLEYRMPDGRVWLRFAPPCPPLQAEGADAS
jgi:hypothetical protein